MSERPAPANSTIAERVVMAFAEGWKTPHPHAWDDLLAVDIALTQPLLRSGVGRALWQDEVARLLSFLPDLTGEVLSWAGRGNVVFIDIVCTATLGGRPLSFRAVDRLTLGPDGRVTHRESFLDPLPVMTAAVTRPGAWLPWWRSGLGPLPGRQRFLPPKDTR